MKRWAIDLIVRAFYTTAAQHADNNMARSDNPGGWFAVAGVPGLVAAQLLTGMGAFPSFPYFELWGSIGTLNLVSRVPRAC